MEDTVPMALTGAEPRAADAPLKAEPLRVEFTASGSEYFRIWIVNLGLTLLTLGLYYPWAKVRKLRYFYGNTSVAGHALDFHGNPRRMLRGYLLMALLFLLYSVSGKVSAVAAVIAAGAIAVLWPALFRASQQFRMANTSWRGLRFGFTGDLRGAYVAVLPVAVPLLLFVLAAPDGVDEQRRPVGGSATMMVLSVLAAVLLSPWCAWLVKRYQHGHYALGRRRTTMSAGVGAFYGLSFKALGVALLAGLAAGAALAAALALWAPVAAQGRPSLRMVLVPLLASLAMYAVLFCVVKTYAASRMQNLVWSSTAAAPLLRFESDLRFASLAGLTAKNLLLTLLTLGLYWPFAAVATARLRLQAVSVFMPRGADHFVATAGGGTQDAAGEAAGDLLGFDVGL
jgi:uncharacterized membrane protein YjgN (DUF898 family)